MAVKTEIKFSDFFSILTNHKLIFLICKSVSVITVSPSILMQPKLIWLAVLSSNYWSFDSNARRFHKIFKILDVFVLLVLFEILSHYIKIASSNWLRKNVHWIIDKIFREKSMVELTLSSRTFLIFWFSPIYIVVFMVIRLIGMFYWTSMLDKDLCPPIEA